MGRRDFLAAAAAAAAPPVRAQALRPNIVLILADDLGYAGSTVCAPSRCCLMTGKYTGHARVRRNGGELLRAGDPTFTEPLKRAGYRTAVYGKWSLGGIGMPGYPTRKGFDDWFGFFNQSHAHHDYPDVLLENNREYGRSGEARVPRRRSGPSHAPRTAAKTPRAPLRGIPRGGLPAGRACRGQEST